MQVTRGGGFGGFESPDGRYFYYAKAEAFPASLWRLPAAGGAEEEVVQPLRGWLHFAVVEGGICFVPPRAAGGTYTLQFYGFADRRVRTLASLCERLAFGFSVSADGRWAAFPCYEFKGGDLILIEGFR